MIYKQLIQKVSGMAIKKFICKNCGVVNEAEITVEDLTENTNDWLSCTLPTGFEWILPAGKITPIVGDPIYISGNGEQLSRENYILKYDIDPEVAYQLMRERLMRNPAYRTLSSQNNEHAKVAQALKFNMMDEDDWTA